MMKKLITSVLLALTVTSTANAQTATLNHFYHKGDVWENGGTWRVTTYCYECNDPAGLQSKSGKKLKYGYVAMNGVPMGTLISIDGEVFEVADRCGIDGTVDIFIENNSGYCQCDLLEYKKIYIKQ